MMERIYKYRLRCRHCESQLIYEVTERRGLPEGWVREEYDNYGENVVNHYCPQHWKEHCNYMIDRGCGNYKFRRNSAKSMIHGDIISMTVVASAKDSGDTYGNV